jgi:hypothetical protein
MVEDELMSLRAKINSAVDKAFTAAGDLVVSGKLSTKTVTGYNFSTGQNSSTSKSITVKVILETTRRAGSESFKTTAMMKSGQAVTLYDTLTIGKEVYNIIDFSDDDFVISLNLSKEKI